MQKKQSYLRIAIMVVIMFGYTVIVNAQPDPGGDPDVPIDGGLSLLLAAGVGYGAKRVHDARKKKRDDEHK